MNNTTNWAKGEAEHKAIVADCRARREAAKEESAARASAQLDRLTRPADMPEPTADQLARWAARKAEHLRALGLLDE